MWLCYISLLISTRSPCSPSLISFDATLLLLPVSNSAVIPISTFYSQSNNGKQTTNSTPKCVQSDDSDQYYSQSNKTSGSYTYASEIKNMQSTNYIFAHETSSLFLGTMPPQSFLDKFLRTLNRVWTRGVLWE